MGTAMMYGLYGAYGAESVANGSLVIDQGHALAVIVAATLVLGAMCYVAGLLARMPEAQVSRGFRMPEAEVSTRGSVNGVIGAVSGSVAALEPHPRPLAQLPQFEH
jgi:hypothetical protein